MGANEIEGDPQGFLHFLITGKFFPRSLVMVFSGSFLSSNRNRNPRVASLAEQLFKRIRLQCNLKIQSDIVCIIFHPRVQCMKAPVTKSVTGAFFFADVKWRCNHSFENRIFTVSDVKTAARQESLAAVFAWKTL